MNTADDVAAGRVYLTVTGTSAEAKCLDIAEATCVLVSRIGWPVETPQVMELEAPAAWPGVLVF